MMIINQNSVGTVFNELEHSNIVHMLILIQQTAWMTRAMNVNEGPFWMEWMVRWSGSPSLPGTCGKKVTLWQTVHTFFRILILVNDRRFDTYQLSVMRSMGRRKVNIQEFNDFPQFGYCSLQILGTYSNHKHIKIQQTTNRHSKIFWLFPSSVLFVNRLSH